MARRSRGGRALYRFRRPTGLTTVKTAFDKAF
ncbi:hypothetical protein CBM2626_A60031 [Cupriavidus taiwanensis]|uniref:Uncharacterized protein n=1 Tax=Cupriavidus taiwanensis TaxID=164546 RepID=A0A375DVQ0_9BURK|nr:hypothetical protein CBM2610_A80009 [Cupriavidus taiwanensis]SOZ49453.1 hypothetical protein CBM2614_A120179 [Cupriavidus taiwanensis]SOZ52029.1 hypothetical protein CBM2613_A110181 [Cupriavidus taiwanensis]SPA00205.1 hypothetical protein CBM2626_A60031 [Cupriavidus taiwanensis]